ncbi:hypothetical protein DDB_G0273555 [Dictyostelium discoideum AX4]|uniref:Translation elongation factor KOW-like domain-containing protein n=1 Tax=Dictyostelium discoideum TaxID=44689 RepID=Q557H6_DICDI|nr:hypothetical protein DDB_G0273411 [Dictyostelium discoideum AX4]XP_644659.1 hypothetical protein DDB_G0273555 [Dictyostelium discoideum AX4]EAL70660.1 hypothetical protein DDB_G0273411 [Dictyostelium discoideum AX4]EAL70732.1 hypothetical protein DDB_G0273555 [Dictyostelium discoideum AX4]|eukprot:XP_644592.1 hypothetical protein DDB_G0273411 [Dictyostelium discoideum AX4]
MNKFLKASTSITRLINRQQSTIETCQYAKRFQEIEASELKKGMWIEHKSKLFQIEKVVHQKVAMRGGFIITDMKNVIDGSKSNIKFRSAENIELVDLSRSTYNFVETIKDGKAFVFRRIDSEGDEEDDEDFVCTNISQLDGYSPYLSLFGEDTEFHFRTYNGNVIDFKGPTQIDLTIRSVSDLQNNNVLHFENGRSCKGPIYLKPGDKVQIRLPEEVFITKV